MGSERLLAEQQEYDRVLAVLRDAMGADAVANTMAIGAAMPQEQVVEEVLATGS